MPGEAWNSMLNHVVDSHLRRGESLIKIKRDQEFTRIMFALGVISSERLRDIDNIDTYSASARTAAKPELSTGTSRPETEQPAKVVDEPMAKPPRPKYEAGEYRSLIGGSRVVLSDTRIRDNKWEYLARFGAGMQLWEPESALELERFPGGGKTGPVEPEVPAIILHVITPSKVAQLYTFNDLPLSTTVQGIKARLRAIIPEHPDLQTQRLIYKRRVLVNSEVLENILDSLTVCYRPLTSYNELTNNT
jgi:hypothetical protein